MVPLSSVTNVHYCNEHLQLKMTYICRLETSSFQLKIVLFLQSDIKFLWDRTSLHV